MDPPWGHTACVLANSCLYVARRPPPPAKAPLALPGHVHPDASRPRSLPQIPRCAARSPQVTWAIQGRGGPGVREGQRQVRRHPTPAQVHIRQAQNRRRGPRCPRSCRLPQVEMRPSHSACRQACLSAAASGRLRAPSGGLGCFVPLAQALRRADRVPRRVPGGAEVLRCALLGRTCRRPLAAEVASAPRRGRAQRYPRGEGRLAQSYALRTFRVREIRQPHLVWASSCTDQRLRPRRATTKVSLVHARHDHHLGATSVPGHQAGRQARLARMRAHHRGLHPAHPAQCCARPHSHCSLRPFPLGLGDSGPPSLQARPPHQSGPHRRPSALQVERSSAWARGSLRFARAASPRQCAGRGPRPPLSNWGPPSPAARTRTCPCTPGTPTCRSSPQPRTARSPPRRSRRRRRASTLGTPCAGKRRSRVARPRVRPRPRPCLRTRGREGCGAREVSRARWRPPCARGSPVG
mmetsp:Transcript_13861/g.41919  ORF Transcript_13861/g.41919 Transcript_13861/m.41919 type:complete len:466 (+) Transcript_13861:773-2170(+)